MRLRFFTLLCCLLPALLHANTAPATLPEFTVGEWQVEQASNRYSRYVHSRKVSAGDAACTQTRIGQVSSIGQLKAPSHLLWDDACALPIRVMLLASRDVDRNLNAYHLILPEVTE